MQETNHQIAERLLRQRGYDKPADIICSVREFMTHYNETPSQKMGKLIQENQLVCLGEYHSYEGRCLHPELIEMAAVNGAKVLFIEAYATEQDAIDNFLQTGDLSQLPDSCGGASLSELLASDVPYLAMLEKARLLGMKIVAVDTKDVPSVIGIDDANARDWHMAQAIYSYFTKYPNDRGIFVVGQLHLLPQPFQTAFTLLKEALKGGVKSIGRAYVDIKQKEQYETLLNIWALMADVSQPVIVPTGYSPFANLLDVQEHSKFVGNDFDYLLLYPYPNDELAKEDLERDRFLREKNLHPANIVAVAESVNMPPQQVAESLALGNLSDRFEQLQVLAAQGDEAARIDSERLAAEVMERAQHYYQIYLKTDQ